jgi:hydroxyacylglutathione hydrolase
MHPLFFAVEEYFRDDYLIAAKENLAHHLRGLRSIGIDQVDGFFDSEAVELAGLRTESYPFATAIELQPRIDAGQVTLFDVRSATEFDAGHIAQAEHHFLGTLLQEVGSLRRDKPVVTQCLGGGRAAIAASLLQRAGFEVVNMQGGYQAWVDAGFPVFR